jgi:N-acetyl-1-D-myo-inositol-2-amino-2-deoxy-alpha-D-glucopyranoside deacetylase
VAGLRVSRSAGGSPLDGDPFHNVRSVLFVHAHPDDETLSTGALILMLIAEGVRVDLLTATRGERGEVVPALRAQVGSDANVLTGIRLDELDRAVDVLGITRAHYLGEPPARAAGLAPRRYTDSGMRWVTPSVAGPVDDAPEDALTRAPESEIVADVLAFLQHCAARDPAGPDLVVSYDDRGGYGHPDHRAIRAAALTASRLAGIPFAEVVPAGTAGALTIDGSTHLARLKDALHAHATQLTVDGDHVVHSGGQREPIVTAVGVRRIS